MRNSRTLKNLLPFSLLCMFLLGCYPTAPYDGLADITFIYKQIQENHPGMYNHLDPTFPTHLDEAYNVHAALLENKDAQGQQEVIRSFIKTFNDGHVAVTWNGVKEISETLEQSTAHFSYNFIATNVCWITLPSFMSLSASQREEFESILTFLPTLTKGYTLVFDLRGNRGGDSYWGHQIVNALFGTEYAENKIVQATAPEYVEWRASPHNIEYYSKVVSILTPDQQKGALQKIEGMKKSLAKGVPYYREEDSPTVEKCSDICPVTSRIIALISKTNGSSVLDFLDYLKMMEHPVTLVGKTTGADSLYMEVHPIPLPSKKGSLWIPIKVYRNRMRGNNVPYVPDIVYEGDMDDTATLQDFVCDIIKR